MTSAVIIRYFQPGSDNEFNRDRWVSEKGFLANDGSFHPLDDSGMWDFRHGCCHNYLGKYQAQVIGLFDPYDEESFMEQYIYPDEPTLSELKAIAQS